MFRVKQEENIKDNRTEKRKTGDTGEDIACTFLMKRGFEIVERNYLKKWGEIDIIARKGQKLHFIEVKTVSHEIPAYSYYKDNYRPEDNLHPWKLKRLSRVIQTYLLGYRPNRDVSYVTRRSNVETDWQFDIITVYLNHRTRLASVEYLEDIII